jgi:hypothetical protein
LFVLIGSGDGELFLIDDLVVGYRHAEEGIVVVDVAPAERAVGLETAYGRQRLIVGIIDVWIVCWENKELVEVARGKVMGLPPSDLKSRLGSE